MDCRYCRRFQDRASSVLERQIENISFDILETCDLKSVPSSKDTAHLVVSPVLNGISRIIGPDARRIYPPLYQKGRLRLEEIPLIGTGLLFRAALYH